MKIVVGLGSIDDFISFAEAGADECFIGYIPESWTEKFPESPLNRREVRYYNVQIGSMSELFILKEMIREKGVPVTIAMNALEFTQEEREFAVEIANYCSGYGFNAYIVADSGLLDLLASEKKKIHLSGEYGELNSLILAMMKKKGVERIIFPRQTTLKEMESMIAKYPEFEYEAFALNEKCHFTGAYCNSLHCDELCHSCRIPYRLVKSESSPGKSQFFEEDWGDPEIMGATGCAFCSLWKLRRIGVTHLKLVSRGNDSESTIKDICLLRRALDILEASNSEEEYIEKMQRELFPQGCSHVCYY